MQTNNLQQFGDETDVSNAAQFSSNRSPVINDGIHRVSKKLCQLIFCCLSVKYKPISIKIAKIVPEQTLNKTLPKIPTSPEVCPCTIPWEIRKYQIDPSTQ